MATDMCPACHHTVASHIPSRVARCRGNLRKRELAAKRLVRDLQKQLAEIQAAAGTARSRLAHANEARDRALRERDEAQALLADVLSKLAQLLRENAARQVGAAVRGRDWCAHER